MFTLRKVLSFSIFGAMAGAVYAAVFYWATVRAAIPVFLGSLIAFLVATPISYFGNRLVTYKSRNVLGPESVRFVAVQSFNLVVTSLIVHVASKLFTLTTFTEIIVAFVAAPMVSFVLYELWVYRQSAETSPNSDT
jgi:putative flippase GtrA